MGPKTMKYARDARTNALFGVFLCFALCWQLVLSSVSFGLQRDGDGALVMVLCSGGNMVTYAVGSDGEPVGDADGAVQSEICPFALASAADVPVSLPVSKVAMSTTITRDISWPVTQPRANLLRVKQQRAPPQTEQIT